MFVKDPLGATHYSEGLATASEAVELGRAAARLPAGLQLRCEQSGRPLALPSPLNPTATVTVMLAGGLPGGKGGFGSLLRSIGAQIEKTTNHEAMRDLSGRRQRDVNNEQRLKKFVEAAPERERLERNKKEQKLEKLRRLAEGENKDKHSFSDPLYDKARSETEEAVHSAVEAAMAVGGEKEAATRDNNNKKDDSGSRKRSTDLEKGGPSKKKPKGLWLGEGLDDLEDDSDLSDSSDGSEEERSEEKAN